MDIYIIFFTMGWIGGSGAVAILWVIWWEREKGRTICETCWPTGE